MPGKFNPADYIDTQDRINRFWTEYPNGSIDTEVTYCPDYDHIIITAKVYKNVTDPRPSASGIAGEAKGVNGMANTTNWHENCETSAIGRALANMGYATSLKDRPNRQEMEKAARGQDAPVRATVAPQRTEPSQSSDSMSTPVPHAQKPITDQQKRQLYALSSEIATARQWPKDWLKDDLYGYFTVTSTKDLTTAQGAHAIAALYAVRDQGAVFADALQQKGS